jgi:hypothetical protein
VRENRTPGSVRGASGNRRPYRDGLNPLLADREELERSKRGSVQSQ